MSEFHYRRGSLFWALILIAIGIIFLEQNFNPQIHPWHIVARYWPVLIIIWGVSKLADYVTARTHPGVTAPPLFSATEVVLLILVLILGTILSRVVLAPWQQWRSEWGLRWDPWENPFVRSYTYTETLNHGVAGPSLLVLSNARGDVVVEGADTSTVSAAVKETIRAATEQEAKNIYGKSNLQMVAANGREDIEPNLDALPNGGANVRLDWTVRVPKRTATQITTARGDILVSGVAGAQDLTSDNGDVHASGVTGNLRVQKNGGSTDIRQVAGDVQVSGRGGDIDIANVKGAVTVEGEFSGSVQFSGLDHGAHFKSSRTELTLGKLSGRLDMEMGSIEASGVDGPVQVTTRQKDVSLRGFKHGAAISDENGNITLQPAGPPSYPIEVSARNGDIVLNLPAASRFTVNASSSHGEVSSDFTAPGLVINTQGDQPSIEGAMGKGGPEIRLKTTYGAIHL
ncbi:MAG: DUF4097 family beta strand repeat-containing protein, partial [Terriglobia bacterium]